MLLSRAWLSREWTPAPARAGSHPSRRPGPLVGFAHLLVQTEDVRLGEVTELLDAQGADALLADPGELEVSLSVAVQRREGDLRVLGALAGQAAVDDHPQAAAISRMARISSAVTVRPQSDLTWA